MGASTGNMLVDNPETLEKVFAGSPTLIATHCEHEPTLRQQLATYKEKYGDQVSIQHHPLIRDEKACALSSSFAIDLARKHGTRLHILHISTGLETTFFDNSIPLREKKITSEACVHHLWFTDADYATKGNRIKWNPAIKSAADRAAIRQAVLDDRIDVIATDHAPHTVQEKSLPYLEAPAGGPLVQHAVVALFDLCEEGVFAPELIVRKTSHAVADLFRIEERGYIREGYRADLALIKRERWMVNPSNILAKCGWSPFEGHTFNHRVSHTWVNGRLVFENGILQEAGTGQRLRFDR